MKEPANYRQVQVPQKFYLLVWSRGQMFQILASASYICLYTMSNPPVGV
jgi:hypothetical protein